MRACRASSPAAQARTSSMSAASLVSGTVPSRLALLACQPIPAGGREPYPKPSAAGVLATPRHAVRPAYAFLEKSWPMQELRCGARRASARSQRIGANNVGRANQRCTRATVTVLVLLLGL